MGNTGPQDQPTGGGGSITLVESTDGTVTVTGGAGPTVNLTGAGIASGNGNPNTNTGGGSQAGTLNQPYVNLTATGQDDWLWRCSVGGGDGVAVWVGKL